MTAWLRHTRIRWAETVRPWQIARSPFFRDRYQTLGPARARKQDDCSVVSLERRFFYCRVPKAANSTVMATLEHARTGRADFTGRDMNTLKGGTYLRAAQLSMGPAQVRAALFTFTIVRHPFARAVSAFNDKMLNASGFHQKHLDRRYPFMHDPRPLEELFDLFLDRLEDPERLHRNRHYAPQTYLMALPPADLDRIGRAERISTDLAEIGRTIFGRDVPIVTWAPHATERAARRMRVEMLTARQKERLARIYWDDFMALPYDVDAYPTRIA